MKLSATTSWPGVSERDRYFGESDAGERPALGGKPPASAIAVDEARQAPGDIGAVHQRRQDSIGKLAAHLRRLSGELSETRCRLEQAEAELADSQLARAQAAARGPGTERIIAETAERASDADRERNGVVPWVTRERDETLDRGERRCEEAIASAVRGHDAPVAPQKPLRAQLREAGDLLSQAQQKLRAEAERTVQELRRSAAEKVPEARSIAGVQPSRSTTHMRVRGTEIGAPPTAGRRPDDELSHRRLVVEAWVSGAALILTVLAFAGFLVTFGMTLEEHVRSALGMVSAVVYLLIVGFLIYGGLVYLLSRLGYMRHRVQFRHAGAEELRRFTAETDATVTVLVPSYKEEPGVVRQTLLSAALQEYPHRRVVLLIDDPPCPSSAEDARLLAATRELPGEINALLALARAPFACAAHQAERRALRGQLDRREATAELADLYSRAAGWFWAQAALSRLEDHAGALFLEMNLHEPARRHAATAEFLHDTLAAEGDYPTEEELLRSYRELGATLHCRGDELRAQALRQPLSCAQQGNEPQQLHRPNGATDRGDTHAARWGHPRGVAECGRIRGSRRRIRAHAGCGQLA